MVSQQELLQETFGDIMRGIGAAAKAVAPGLVQKFDAVAEPFKAFKSKQPVAVLKEALRTTYFNTFDNKTVKIGKPVPLQGDKSGMSRISIPFTATRIKGVSSNKPVGTGVQGGTVGPDTYTAVLTRSKKGVGGEYSVEIRDQNNRVIAGEKQKREKNVPSWDQEYEEGELPPNPSINDIEAWIEGITWVKGRILNSLYRILPNNTTPVRSQTLGSFMLSYLDSKGLPVQAQPPTDPQEEPLTPQQVDALKQIFVQRRVFTENKAQKSQLNFLIDSYNMRYEVSINKGN
jgi:hypothetical protein